MEISLVKRFAIAAALLIVSTAHAALSIMPLKEVRAGMRGTGKTVFNGDKIRWSFGAKNVAILCDLAQPVDVSNADKANAFALDFLGRLLALPERPNDSIKTFVKQCGDVWGGYVDRGVYLEGGRPTTPWEWDTSFLFITDGRHVLVRWVLLEPEDRHGGKTTGYASGPVPPKTKSRFDD